MRERQTGFRIRALTAAFLLFLVSGSGAVASLVIITPEGGKSSLEGAEEALREGGGRVFHRFPGEGLIAEIPRGGVEALRRGLPPGWRVEPLDRAAGSSLGGRGGALVEPSGKGSRPTGGRPLAGDALERPRSEGKGGEEPGFWDGSEYLLGDVGVALFFLESDGSIDPSLEDWTDEERRHVEARVVEATEWWRSRAPEGFLRFTYEFHPSVSVSYEPITRPQEDEDLWIREALATVGFSSGDRFTRTQEYLNDMKARLGLDWAFALFIIDSSADGDGMFADGYFAYAYVGGPFAVLTLDNDGWGMENFASVCAHEIGHLFYALDQYASARVPCDRTSGYLGVATANSGYGECPEEEPLCIMRSTHLGVATMSETVRGQVGWFDENGNGVPDPIDREPAVTADADLSGDSVVVSGKASVVPTANENPLGYGHDLSVSTIVAVEYRTDGGEWREVVGAVSGEPSTTVDFDLRVSMREVESGEIEVRARDSAGLDSPTLTLSLSGGEEKDPAAGADPEPLPGPVRILGNRPNPFNPSTEIRFRLDGEARVRLDVFDMRGALVRRLADEVSPAGERGVVWDGRDAAGRDAPSGLYIFRVLVEGESRALPITLIR